MARNVILFLAANPVGPSPAGASLGALYEECAAIENELRKAENPADFMFRPKWTSNVDDVMFHLNELQPTVIHFSGHGGGSADVYIPGAPPQLQPTGCDLRAGARAGIRFEDDKRQPQYVTPHALTQMIKSAAPSARLVVLNACFSSEMAVQLCSAVQCVVGMRGTIGDAAARSFAVGFYRALGFRRSIGNAVAQAVATLMAKQYTEEHLPICCTRNGIDAEHVRLCDELVDPGMLPTNRRRIVKIIVGDIATRGPITGRDIHLSRDIARARAKSCFDHGQRKVHDWSLEMLRSGWSEQAWQDLGDALELTLDAIEMDCNWQSPWTLMADVYHHIGEADLALECLEQSEELAPPGPGFPGGYHKDVKSKIDSGYPFDGASALRREPPPSWFAEKYHAYLTQQIDRSAG
jgi:CHAT domain-containing protein